MVVAAGEGEGECVLRVVGAEGDAAQQAHVVECDAFAGEDEEGG
ncbi:hypothetical protein [Streptomyces sp. MUM 203J]|nr:hypothetical protein [Streptomyces sp. MUM 203J]